MIKYFCDICEKEMESDQEGGMMILMRKSFIFVRHNKEQAMEKITYLFCPECSEKMKAYKKELQNKK